MIIKSENTGEMLLPSKAFLFGLAVELAKEATEDIIKEMDLMDD